MSMNPIPEAKIRVCSGTLAEHGKDTLRLEFSHQESDNTISIRAYYTDTDGFESVLNPNDLKSVVPVANLSAYQQPRKWVFPSLCVLTSWFGGKYAFGYMAAKNFSNTVLMISLGTVTFAQFSSAYYAGVALSRVTSRAVIETEDGHAVIEGNPWHIALLIGAASGQVEDIQVVDIEDEEPLDDDTDPDA